MNWKTFFKKGKLLVGIPLLLLGVFVFLQPSFAKNFIIAPNATDRVSIGTTAAPGYTLDVAGTGRFTGALIVPAPSSSTHAVNRSYVDSVVLSGGQWTDAGSYIYANNASSVVVNDSGNIGIGTTNPQAKLDINGGAIIRGSDAVLKSNGNQDLIGTYNGWGYNTIFIAGYNNVNLPASRITTAVSIGGSGSQRMFIDLVSGNVGIGTTAPSQKLHVAGNVQVDGAIVAPEGVLRDDVGGWVRTYGNTGWYSQTYGGGWYMTDTTYLRSYNDKPIYVGAGNSYFGGNVGIGTTNPASKLEVGGGNIEVGNGYQFGWRYSAGDGNMYNSIVSNYTTDGGIQYKSGSWTSNTTLIAHNFQTWMSSAWQSSLTILQNGNVGISTTTPAYKLDVNGTGRFTGTLTVPTPSATSHAANKGYVDSIVVGHGDGTNCSTGYFAAGVDASGNAQGCANSIANSTNASYATNAGYATSAGTAGALSSTSLCSSGYYARGITTSGAASGCTAVPTGGHGDGTNCSAGYYPLGVDASGNVQSCTAVPTGGHGNGSNCSAGYYPLGVDASGNVESCTAVPTIPFNPTFGTVTATSYLYSSDAKLKTNIKTIKDPLEKITALRGVTFNWKNSKEPSVGLIAQEVEKVFPELVETNGQYKAVEYGNLVAPLIEAIKAQQQQIEQLEARIVSLESNR